MSLRIRHLPVLPLTLLALACAAAPEAVVEGEPSEPELVGRLTRAEIEAAVPDWVFAQVEAAPDPDQAVVMASAGSPESRVTVYLGTWCSDSRRELARLWRAMDEAGGEVAFELDYVGIRRDKEQRDPSLESVGLLYVPTFVVEEAGAETGRIIETSPNGIEFDLAALLDGEVIGVVAVREELLRP